MAKKKEKAGRLSIDQMRKLINKKAGQEVSIDLADDNNPTIVKQPAANPIWLLKSRVMPNGWGLT